MTLYHNLQKIFPYLKSIRHIENYISIDVEFNKSWKAPKSIISNAQYITNKSDNPDMNLLSFAGEFTESEVSKVLDVVENIIEFNLELERKNSLLENKINELKVLFNRSSLQDLESLEFKINKEEDIVVSDHE